MNKLLIFATLFTIFVVPLNVRADIFISNGTTLYFNETSPLEQYAGIKEIRKRLVGFEAEPCFDCYSSFYSAEWMVIENELYLTGIYSSNSKNLKADLNSLFGVHDGKVKADWVTTDLWLHGKNILADIDIINAIYKSEKRVSIANGKITGQKDYNYQQAKQSVYSRNQDSLNYFLYSNINWRKLPDLSGKVKKVYVAFESGASGKPENLKIMRGADDSTFNEEALRVIGMLPWNVYYSHGKILVQAWIQPVVFSEGNRNKYAQ